MILWPKKKMDDNNGKNKQIKMNDKTIIQFDWIFLFFSTSEQKNQRVLEQHCSKTWYLQSFIRFEMSVTFGGKSC